MGNTNGHTLLIGTSEGLYKAEPTKDGYATRKLGLEGLGDMRAAVVVDRNDALTFYAGTIKGGMFRSRDGGETWASINKGLLHKTVWSITQHRETGDLYVGASPASVFVSKDQGDTWTECESLELMKETKEWNAPRASLHQPHEEPRPRRLGACHLRRDRGRLGGSQPRWWQDLGADRCPHWHAGPRWALDRRGQ